MTSSIPLSHPGEILREEFLDPLGLSQYRLAKEIKVPARRINEIIQGKRSITPDTALRLACYFGMSEKFFLNLQMDYDLRCAKRALKATLDKIIIPFTYVKKPSTRS